MAEIKRKKEIYRNNIPPKYRFRYPREKRAQAIMHKREKLTTDGINFADLIITGIPDGVMPEANLAEVWENAARRLYIFSVMPLSEKDLKSIDNFYGTSKPYPIFSAVRPIGNLPTIPLENFYLCDDPPSCIQSYVEYRYFESRSQPTKIAYCNSTGNVYRLVLDKPLKVIIMPSNFIRTGGKSGYFRFENNLIVYVFSKVLLSSAIAHNFDEGDVQISKIDTTDKRLMRIITNLFTRLGVHNVATHQSDQIFAYDSDMTMVVGSVSNIVWPSTQTMW